MNSSESHTKTHYPFGFYKSTVTVDYKKTHKNLISRLDLTFKRSKGIVSEICEQGWPPCLHATVKLG